MAVYFASSCGAHVSLIARLFLLSGEGCPWHFSCHLLIRRISPSRFRVHAKSYKLLTLHSCFGFGHILNTLSVSLSFVPVRYTGRTIDPSLDPHQQAYLAFTARKNSTNTIDTWLHLGLPHAGTMLDAKEAWQVRKCVRPPPFPYNFPHPFVLSSLLIHDCRNDRPSHSCINFRRHPSAISANRSTTRLSPRFTVHFPPWGSRSLPASASSPASTATSSSRSVLQSSHGVESAPLVFIGRLPRPGLSSIPSQ